MFKWFRNYLLSSDSVKRFVAAPLWIFPHLKSSPQEKQKIKIKYLRAHRISAVSLPSPRRLYGMVDWVSAEETLDFNNNFIWYIHLNLNILIGWFYSIFMFLLLKKIFAALTQVYYEFYCSYDFSLPQHSCCGEICQLCKVFISLQYRPKLCIAMTWTDQNLTNWL